MYPHHDAPAPAQTPTAPGCPDCGAPINFCSHRARVWCGWCAFSLTLTPMETHALVSAFLFGRLNVAADIMTGARRAVVIVGGGQAA